MTGAHTVGDKTLLDLCRYLDLDFVAFMDDYNRDDVGGYPEKWKVGSIWESEGKILYAIAKQICPRVVLEFGTRFGCSTTHLLKALDDNNYGEIVTVDNGANGPPGEMTHRRLTMVNGEGVAFSKTWDRTIDLIFEDGPHSTEFTREVIRNCLPYLSENGIVCVHDTEHFLVGEDVSRGFQEAVGNFGRIIIPPSDCGLGYWRKHV